MAKQEYKVKALYTKHAIGENVIEKCWAQKKNGKVYLYKPSRTKEGAFEEVPVEEGQELLGGKVAIEKRLVRIGESCMPLFETNDPNVKLATSFARSTRGKKGQPKVFMYETVENGKDVIKRLQEGKNHPQMGKVEVLENGHLKVGSSLITVAPKQYEILFKAEFDPNDEVAKTFKENKPYKASMVTKVPGGEEHWIHGYYFPGTSDIEMVDGKENKVYKPASFQEYGPDGYLYETASFADRAQPSKDDLSGAQDKVAKVTVRSLEDAMRKHELSNAMKSISDRLNHISDVIGRINGEFSKEDHPLYQEGDEVRLESMHTEYEALLEKEKGNEVRFSFMFGEKTMKEYVALGQKPPAPTKANAGWAGKGP